jgi:hypothetical protein
VITTRDRLIASRAIAAQRRWVAEAGECSEGWMKLPESQRLEVLQRLADAKVDGSISADAAQAAIGALLATVGARTAALDDRRAVWRPS